MQEGDFPNPCQVKPNLDSALEAICLKAMALKPSDRYAAPRDLAEDIEHWLGDEPVSAMPEPITVKAGRWMRRHKPLVSGAAASLFVGLIALGVGAVWYEIQQAEAERKQVVADAEADRKQALADMEAARKQKIAEEKIREAVDQARKTRDELHKILKKPGGVHELLNQPERWQAQIKSARADWQRAIDNVEAAADPQWTDQVKLLHKELARDQADYDLAMRLEKIRLDKIMVSEGRKSDKGASKQYAAAFAKAGLTPVVGRQKAVALLIRQSAIKDQLVAALDDWARYETTPHLLLEVARLADPDPWCEKARNPDLWENKQAIENLVKEAQIGEGALARLSPQILGLVGALLPKGQARVSWLRMAQGLYPADFWVTLSLASSLREAKNYPEAVAFCRVALAIRPNSSAVYNNLGNTLHDQRNLPAAIDAFKKALAIDPQFSYAWNGLGAALSDQKNLPAAINAFKKALAIDPQLDIGWSNLGNALRDQRNLPAAIDACHKAIAINPQFASAWNNLGNALCDQKNMPAAIDAYNKALDIDPELARAWSNLSAALRTKRICRRPLMPAIKPSPSIRRTPAPGITLVLPCGIKRTCPRPSTPTKKP